MGKKNKKKDAQLVLRLDKNMRDEFIAACKDLDTSAAREVRKYRRARSAIVADSVRACGTGT